MHMMNLTKVAICLSLLGLAAFFAWWQVRSTHRRWVTSERTYEGFPLYLRRPTNADTAANRRRYLALAVITHEFTKRYPDGRPEPAYNKTLVDLDQKIVASFDSPPRGVPVLIETFGGKRHYYFYVVADTDVSAVLQAITRQYPNEKLTWDVRANDKWAFIDKYAKAHF